MGGGGKALREEGTRLSREGGGTRKRVILQGGKIRTYSKEGKNYF